MSAALRLTSLTGVKILLGIALALLLARAAYGKNPNGVRVFWISAAMFAIFLVLV